MSFKVKLITKTLEKGFTFKKHETKYFIAEKIDYVAGESIKIKNSEAEASFKLEPTTVNNVEYKIFIQEPYNGQLFILSKIYVEDKIFANFDEVKKDTFFVE